MCKKNSHTEKKTDVRKKMSNYIEAVNDFWKVRIWDRLIIFFIIAICTTAIATTITHCRNYKIDEK